MTTIFATNHIYKDFTPGDYLNPNTVSNSPHVDNNSTTPVDYCYVRAESFGSDSIGTEAVFFVQPASLGSADTVTFDLWFEDQVTPPSVAGPATNDTWIPLATGLVGTAGQPPVVIKVAPNMRLYTRITGTTGSPQSLRLGFRPADGTGGGSNAEDVVSVAGTVKVQEAGVNFIAGGVTSCATSTLVATGQSGPGWLTIVNLDGSNTIYIGLTGVTTNGLPLPPGTPDTSYYNDVSTIFATGSTTVGWGLRR